MKNVMNKLIAMLLCAVLLAGIALLLPTQTEAAAIESYDDYGTIANIYDLGDCPSMQGFAVDNTYLYCVKANTTTETSAIITRTNRLTGDTVYMTNSATGGNYFDYLGHANDMAVTSIDGVTNLFVASAEAGSYSLIRFKVSGSSLILIGHYTSTYNGTSVGFGGVQILHQDDSQITLLIKRGNSLYTSVLDIDSTGGTLTHNYLCTLNRSEVTINGAVRDLTDFLGQGFGYYDNKVYVPLSGGDAYMDISAIVVYDIEGASGTIKNDPSQSIWIQSTSYPALFEIESCGICPADGRLYFNTNRRLTSSDTNHDGVHYLWNYTYDPARDTDAPANYRWEMIDDVLQSVTVDGTKYSSARMHNGSITDGAITGGQYYIDNSIILEHDRPWVLEWKAKGTYAGGVLLMASNKVGNREGTTYLFRRTNSSLVALGEYSDGQYNNYGLTLSDYGVDGTAEHVYALKNRIAADGSNMVYLFVDGKELGPMNNYHIGGTAQGTTSDWVSGKDFTFSYFGTEGHPLQNCSIDYIQVWYDGVYADEPNTYRWETRNNVLTNITTSGLNANAVSVIAGTCTDGVYADSRLKLAKDVVLLHDRPWSMEWKSSGSWDGSLMFASTPASKNQGAHYLFRAGGSSVLSLGANDGTSYHNYGIKLSDHGIDGTAEHVYRLTNRIADDGSNMVYLFVDGQELGPLNRHYIATTYQNATSDWVSGKDFTFSYLGTVQHALGNCEIDYIQVWEAGIPADDQADKYRWETQNDALTNVTSNGNGENPATILSGTCTDGVYAGGFFELENTVFLKHDEHWIIEWQSEGDWQDQRSGAMLFASGRYGNDAGLFYLYRRGNSELLALGERLDGKHHNYGLVLSDYGIDGTAPHVYRLTNRVAADGSNMVYLSVDGEEIGPMNNYYVGITSQNTTSDWLSGKDLTISYFGTTNYTIGNCSIDYIQIWESCAHTYGGWSTVTPMTCTTDGLQQRICTECGEVEKQVIAASGHAYSGVSYAGDCQTYEHTCYTCSNCGHSYNEYPDTLLSDWVEVLPDGIDASLTESKQQYRYSDYETTTSYETTLSGYTLLTSAWEKTGSGTVSYVNSWPSGFSTSSSIYSTYNKKSAKVSASETTTTKTEINSDAVVGYLWYHWCYASSYYSRETQDTTDGYTTFHAFYSTTAPGDCTNYDASDNSYYNPNSSCCSNSDWFWHVEVYAQKYTTYQKLFTYERWTDYSDWSDTAATAGDTRKVEERTLYRYVNAPLGDHSWTEGVCSACGEVCGHSYESGTCTVCGMVEPVTVPTMSFTSASLSLAGDIGLNFFVKMDESLLADSQTRIEFSYAGKVQTVYLADAEPTTLNGVSCYMFTCKLWVTEMAKTVTAQMYNSDGMVGQSKDYSVKKYCDAVFSYIETYPGYAASFEKAAPLLKAMLNYGAAAQALFTNDTEDQYANVDLSDADKVLNSDYEYESFKHSIVGSESGIAITGINLVLDTTTSIRYTFTLDGSKTIDQYTFLVDGKKAEPVCLSGNTYYVEMVGVMSNNLDYAYTCVVGGLSVSYSARSYVRQVNRSYADNAKMIAFADALYAYSQAAEAYCG